MDELKKSFSFHSFASIKRTWNLENTQTTNQSPQQSSCTQEKTRHKYQTFAVSQLFLAVSAFSLSSVPNPTQSRRISPLLSFATASSPSSATPFLFELDAAPSKQTEPTNSNIIIGSFFYACTSHLGQCKNLNNVACKKQPIKTTRIIEILRNSPNHFSDIMDEILCSTHHEKLYCKNTIDNIPVTVTVNRNAKSCNAKATVNKLDKTTTIMGGRMR
jgi:hypothetical protein